ncbi:bifunctional prephenate dehydrogenase/3-phosphoshikimate 1-carboxyvinyltransferase [Aquirhabdus parva]|uniref:3-phosphoshikimate 1-carboxyvinyltransferase n=1 Tax=Aquirhabdus parva TaxID=2283318 RepID=A0A345P4Y7_9GAMM|nr:bifunctional prephenate dehydrogenase/3-phosphoshikimate 1-carboxyvinyltransferase [Aquirhabdus parva]AXI02346.1 bifunctional prephenate dehydrogenase/3-phosphoshikimate 1-carboxyvinyltransferase [Aquirhabdus parva]
MSEPVTIAQDLTQKVIFDKVAFIGLGLIGSSLARVLRANHLARQIVASTRSQTTLDQAQTLGVIDAGFSDPIEAVKDADLIVLAMPVGATEAVLRLIASSIRTDAIITDVGSTKGNVVQAAINVFGDQLPSGFVPAHPIAGAEKSGVMAGKVDLFRHHKVIVTPLDSTSVEALEKVTMMWKSAGADVLKMTVADHDEILAHTSHLPHLLAFNLVDQLASRADNLDIFRFAAGGFRDFTRIAASDPQMWHDIFLANKKAILAAIDGFTGQLQQLKSLIEHDDSTSLIGTLTRAQAARTHFTHMIEKTPYLESAMSNSTTSQQFIVQPGGTMSGTLTIPGDKSVSHRSIMLGALAEGTTYVTGFLEGEDALATLQAFRDMGVVITDPKNGEVTIHGVGLQGLKPPKGALYMGNSGTTTRLISGILSAQPFDTVLTGDPSLTKRPMERIAKPLRLMGAKIQTTGEKGTPPISISGGQALQGIDYLLPMASAQVKSGILLAALWAKGKTTVTEPEPTRDHTERMLTAFGYPVSVDGNKVTIEGGGKLTATNIQVPADISSATFFMVAAAITANSNVVLRQVGINPTRTGVLEILKQMGANISLENQAMAGGEPVADIRIQAGTLKGIHIPEDQVPLAIDEFPALFIAAACAEGRTVLTGAAELRVKESDRIQVMADGLRILGVDCTPTEDGMIIEGKGSQGAVFGSGTIESHHDHRIAMSFAIAGLRASGVITINGTETVATSFPNFTVLAQQAGLTIGVK